MSDIRWTEEQRAAIEAVPGDLLVSAAAGAGKTAVLVERVISKLLDWSSPVDIDDFLIVTFTEAAAAEMRQRIAAALTAALADKPDDARLQRQTALINKADISTLHAFCARVVRRYFYLLDLDPAFKVADDHESALTKYEVLEALWEQKYSTESDFGGSFTALHDLYGAPRSDDDLKELILRLYDMSRSQPWPDSWLSRLADSFDVRHKHGLLQLPFGRPLFRYARLMLERAAADMKEALHWASASDGPAKYQSALELELAMIEDMGAAAGSDDWTHLSLALTGSFGRLPPTGERDGVDPDLKKYCTVARDRAKAAVKKLREDVFGRSESDLIQELGSLAPHMETLADLTVEFGRHYQLAKRARSRLDFADLEHYALQILRDPASVPDVVQPSAAAVQLKEQYFEVLVDEYQDINPVQDAILNLVARHDRSRSNLFVVGDVKQSIYGFRLAEPNLFLTKYHSYGEKESDPQRRLLLTANFRSRPGVVDAVNYVFQQLFIADMGGLSYDAAARLSAGTDYKIPPAGLAVADNTTELHLVERRAEPDSLAGSTEQPEAADVLEDADLDALEKEALIVGRRIHALVNGTADQPGGEFQVWDKDADRYRPLMYKDIVILLRTVRGRANRMLEVFRRLEIPAYADLGTGYLAAPEIRVMISLLSVIDNPRQDIDLAAVLRSPIVGLTGAELAEVRLADREGDFYQALSAAAALPANESCSGKCAAFLRQLDSWRTLARRRSLGELIWQIYSDTGYMTYVAALPAGAERQANLRALYDRARQFESYGHPGLFRFLRFLERLQAQEGDFGTARALGENEDVVRLMSIHKSKGLEFPVVFVADLGKQFNMQDLKGDVLLHKKLGLGPVVTDLTYNVKYPSVAHRAARLAAADDVLAEELRVLYVAFTRAKEKLILVGSVNDLDGKCRAWSQNSRLREPELPAAVLSAAATYLDWLGPAIARHPDGIALRFRPGEDEGQYLLQDPSAWKVELYDSVDFTQPWGPGQKLAQAADTRPVDIEPLLPQVERALSWRYPSRQAPQLAAKVSVSELKGRLVIGRSVSETEEEPALMLYPASAERPQFISGSKGLSPVERGSAVHLVLEQLDLKGVLSIEGINEQLENMVQGEFLTADAAAAVDVAALSSFFAGPVGRRLTARPDAVRKEVPFSMRLPAKDVYPGRQLTEIEALEPVLVQGIIDCLLQEETGWLLLDFKTDRIGRSRLGERLEEYEWQLRLYAQAVEAFSSHPVSEACICFLATGQTVPVRLDI